MSLNYYAHPGQIELNTHMLTSVQDQSKSTLNVTNRVAFTQFFGALNYGVAPRLRVGVNETILWDQTNDTINAAGAESISTSAGPSNPTLVGAWRFFESGRRGLSTDLSLSVTPSFGPHVNGDGSLGKTGNNLTGGWLVQPSLSAFWRLYHNQLELMATAVRNDVSLTQGSAGNDNKAQAYWSNSLSLVDRYHLDHHHFLQINIVYGLPSRHNITSAAGDVTENRALSSVVPTLTYGYSPDPDVVVELVATWKTTSVDGTNLSKATVNRTDSSSLTATVALLHKF